MFLLSPFQGKTRLRPGNLTSRYTFRSDVQFIYSFFVIFIYLSHFFSLPSNPLLLGLVWSNSNEVGIFNLSLVLLFGTAYKSRDFRPSSFSFPSIIILSAHSSLLLISFHYFLYIHIFLYLNERMFEAEIEVPDI